MSEVSGVARKGGVAVVGPGQERLSSSPSPEPEPQVQEGPTEVDSVELSLKNKGKATVMKILKGKLGDFIPANKLRNPDYAARDAVQVHFQTEDGRTFRETFTLSLSANSKLRRFLAKYGKLAKNVEVEYAEDARGFPRVVL